MKIYMIIYNCYDSDFDTQRTVYIRGIYNNRDKAKKWIDQQGCPTFFSIIEIEINNKECYIEI